MNNLDSTVLISFLTRKYVHFQNAHKMQLGQFKTMCIGLKMHLKVR